MAPVAHRNMVAKAYRNAAASVMVGRRQPPSNGRLGHVARSHFGADALLMARDFVSKSLRTAHAGLSGLKLTCIKKPLQPCGIVTSPVGSDPMLGKCVDTAI